METRGRVLKSNTNDLGRKGAKLAPEFAGDRGVDCCHFTGLSFLPAEEHQAGAVGKLN